jgi:ribosomal protein S18 acetylase RimI-like enzyme
MMIDAELAFDAAMARRLPHVHIRAESVDDAQFLIQLFADCSPMAGVLPEPIMVQQAELANHGFWSGYPKAMKRIAYVAGEPVGRIMIDWNTCHGVDIAVLQSARNSGVALAMLRSWLEVADSMGRICTLDVLANNPAMRIYQRLGFVPVDQTDEYQAVIAMLRPVRAGRII